MGMKRRSSSPRNIAPSNSSCCNRTDMSQTSHQRSLASGNCSKIFRWKFSCFEISCYETKNTSGKNVARKSFWKEANDKFLGSELKKAQKTDQPTISVIVQFYSSCCSPNTSNHSGAQSFGGGAHCFIFWLASTTATVKMALISSCPFLQCRKKSSYHSCGKAATSPCSTWMPFPWLLVTSILKIFPCGFWILDITYTPFFPFIIHPFMYNNCSVALASIATSTWVMHPTLTSWSSITSNLIFLLCFCGRLCDFI